MQALETRRVASPVPAVPAACRHSSLASPGELFTPLGFGSAQPLASWAGGTTQTGVFFPALCSVTVGQSLPFPGSWFSHL